MKRNRRQIDTIIKQSKVISPGKPTVYQIVTRDVFYEKKENYRKCEYGHKSAKAAQDKVIVFIGVKGSGKRTLINGLVIVGVYQPQL